LSAEAVAIENALGELLDNAPCGFVSFRDDGSIVDVNATLLERLGYAREEISDRHFETLLAMGSRIFYQTHFFPLLKLDGHAQEVFMLLRARNGEDVGMLCNAVRHHRHDADVIDCVFMEVRERRKFEEALLQARQAADEANQAKSSFLAVMSHELRTPLNAIGGYVQLLTMGIHGPVTPQQEEALGRIERSQRHLLGLINDVLNLARIEAGRVDYVVQKVPLSDVVATTLPMVDPQIAKKALRLEAAVPSELSAKADREKVQQILLNLLTNAVKFTPSGGSLTVEAGPVDDSRVYLSVSDTGVGIPAEMIDKVFEPFMQVKTNRTARSEGTGLGLAISRDLARGMGGDLSASSEQGVGSVFTLTLPTG
jgi:PAS domain S-box-containing protein